MLQLHIYDYCAHTFRFIPEHI